jgi:tRNA(Ile)-lysidine synthase
VRLEDSDGRFSCDDAGEARPGLRTDKSSEQLQGRLTRHLKELAWFRAGLKIGVGVSGGADSVALLTLLAELRAKLGIVVSVVHFNHKLRGRASDLDEKFVEALAEKLGSTLHLGRADVAGKAKLEKANLEDAARRARYGFFERLVEQGLLDIVATAHTMEDQAETVLAHILRGTGIAGLAGIHPVAGRVARPLLGFRREELRKYLRARKQAWREDATNRDKARTRARMRETLFPLLAKQFNPAVIEHLAALADRAREQASFLEHLALHLFQKNITLTATTARVALSELLNPLAIEQAGGASAALRARLIQEIVGRVRQRPGQISIGHIESIIQLAKSGEPGKRLQIPGGVDVLRERDALVFMPRPGLK